MATIGEARVAVSRRIDAPVDQVFALLADPAAHPSFDGSGMVRDGSANAPIGGVGDVFTMQMHNDEIGDYEMRNVVVEYEPNRRIMWEPVLSAVARPDRQADVDNPAFHVWGYELEPVGAATVVTEIFDCRRSPRWLREATREGERWEDAMTTSLELLEERVSGR